MTQTTDLLLREEDAAQYLGMKSSTLRQWRSRSQGPAYHKFGARVLYRMSDLEDFIERSRISLEPGV